MYLFIFFITYIYSLYKLIRYGYTLPVDKLADVSFLNPIPEKGYQNYNFCRVQHTSLCCVIAFVVPMNYLYYVKL